MKQKFTYLKSIFKLSCALTFALGAFNVNAQTTTIFSEDFSGITIGDNTTTTGSETAWTKNANLATAFRTFQAGGVLRLGASGLPGYIITAKTLDLSQNGGNFTVSFDVKGWTTVESLVNVIVSNQSTQQVSYTSVINGDFQHITLGFTGGKTKSSLQLASNNGRVFIDNVLVTTSPVANLKAPSPEYPADVETTSFTPNWAAVPGATGYFLDLSTDVYFATFVPGYQNLAVSGTSLPISGLTATTQYFYRLRAVNATQQSITSDTVGAVTACINTPTVAAQSFCVNEGAKVGDLTAVASGDATLEFTDQDGTPALENSVVLTTKSYYARQVLGTCESSWKRFDVTIITVTAPEVATTTQTFCATAPHTVANLEATSTDPATTLQWYADATTTTALTATTELKAGSYFVTQKLNDCESVRKEVVVAVSSTAKPEGAVAQTFCSTTAPTVASITATALDTATLQWYADATSTDVLATTAALKSGSYFVTQKLNDCESERKEVVVTVLTVTKPTGIEKQDFTDGQTLADLDVDANENLVWFSDAELTKVLPLTTVLTNATTYYAAEKTGDCTSDALAVTANKVLSTDNFDAVSFKFYPNPVSDIVTVSYSQNITAVVVYNLVGQAVLSAKPNTATAQINMSSLSAGCYMVNIAAGNQSKTIKLIKQ